MGASSTNDDGSISKMSTACVHAGATPDPLTGAIVRPIYQSTTFVQPSVDDYMSKGFSYSRSDNPTVRCLEDKINELEGGAAACCFTTGMAATCSLFSVFLRPGDHCLMTNCCYGGTDRAARQHFSEMGIEFEFVDMRDTAGVAQKVKKNTKMIFSETPTNPTLFLADVRGLSDIAKKHDIVHVCDSTFATPLITRPLSLGATYVLVSTTKYFDGHNLTVGGCVVSSTTELDAKVRWMRNVMGNIMSPQVAFYQLQCAKTLAIRLPVQSKSADTIARFLQKHPAVDTVRYPGLEDFPQRELALRQHNNNLHGSMLWFEVKGGTDAGVRLMNNIGKPWSLCENLGTVESIITCPAVFTHAQVPREARYAIGVTDGFIRVSVGIEDTNELIDALKTSLDMLL